MSKHGVDSEDFKSSPDSPLCSTALILPPTLAMPQPERELPAAKKAKTSSASVSWTHPCSEMIQFKLLEGATEQELKAQIKAGGNEFGAEFFHQVGAMPL